MRSKSTESITALTPNARNGAIIPPPANPNTPIRFCGANTEIMDANTSNTLWVGPGEVRSSLITTPCWLRRRPFLVRVMIVTNESCLSGRCRGNCRLLVCSRGSPGTDTCLGGNRRAATIRAECSGVMPLEKMPILPGKLLRPCAGRGCRRATIPASPRIYSHFPGISRHCAGCPRPTH